MVTQTTKLVIQVPALLVINRVRDVDAGRDGWNQAV
jgi:hypothetical protein